MIAFLRSCLILLVCCTGFVLLPMSHTRLPNDVWHTILDYAFTGESRTLNRMVRRTGVNTLLAHKIITSYMPRTKLYPYSQEAIEIMLTSFKTSEPGINLQSSIETALRTQQKKYPLLMALYARNLEQFRTIAYQHVICFNPDSYAQFIAYGPFFFRFDCLHFKFPSLEQAYQLRKLIADQLDEATQCHALILRRIQGLRASEQLRDSIHSKLPLGIYACGALPSYMRSLLAHTTPLHGLSFTALAGALAYYLAWRRVAYNRLHYYCPQARAPQGDLQVFLAFGLGALVARSNPTASEIFVLIGLTLWIATHVRDMAHIKLTSSGSALLSNRVPNSYTHLLDFTHTMCTMLSDALVQLDKKIAHLNTQSN